MIIQRQSLATQIYQDMRARIVTGDLTPGTSLTLGGLAKHYAVSVTPVREAIRNLAGDGLIDLTSHLRPVVSSWGQNEVRQVLEARLMIELHVIDQAVEHITQEELDALRDLNRHIASLAGVLEPEETNDLLKSDKAFHLGLVRPAGNKVIERLYDNLPGHLPTLRQTTTRQGFDAKAMYNRHMKVNAQHDDILAAYGNRDAARAREAVELHIRSLLRWAEDEDTA